MSVASRIKELRESKGLTRAELAQILGITVGAISNYENGVSSPKEPILFKIIETMGCDANYLFQDVVNIPPKVNDVTLAEYDHIKKYRNLDDKGRAHVDTVLDWETQRMELYKQALAEREQQKPQIVEIEKVAPPRYSIIYYQRLASAGTGEYLFNDIPTDIIEVLDTPIARRADFALGVNGNSMEPTYYDGDKVYVEITDEIPTGSIGIFTRGNECLIKELGTDRLISHNKEYGDIPAREDIKLVGLVLGKVAEV